MKADSQFAPRVLIAIGDQQLRHGYEIALRGAGFIVCAPTTAPAAALLATSFSPDVLVVDTTLRADDNTLLYLMLQSLADAFLLCVAVVGQDRARIEALRAGADDVVSIPTTAEEVASRCHALVRRPRSRRGDWDIQPQSQITLGPLMIDAGRHAISLNGHEVPATRIEFTLLEYLCRRPTEVATRHDLLESIWGPNWFGDTHGVDVHLSNLRRKLDLAAPEHRVIHTVRGVGFRIGDSILLAAGAFSSEQQAHDDIKFEELVAV